MLFRNIFMDHLRLFRIEEWCLKGINLWYLHSEFPLFFFSEYSWGGGASCLFPHSWHMWFANAVLGS
jgi:hypothetical protein